MRLQVVHCHPLTESYDHALFRAIVETLERNGHSVVATDLYREGFRPAMTGRGASGLPPSARTGHWSESFSLTIRPPIVRWPSSMSRATRTPVPWRSPRRGTGSAVDGSC